MVLRTMSQSSFLHLQVWAAKGDPNLSVCITIAKPLAQHRKRFHAPPSFQVRNMFETSIHPCLDAVPSSELMSTVSIVPFKGVKKCAPPAIIFPLSRELEQSEGPPDNDDTTASNTTYAEPGRVYYQGQDRGRGSSSSAYLKSHMSFLHSEQVSTYHAVKPPRVES